MSIIFFAPSHDIVVYRSVDGEYSWSGKYNGLPLREVLPEKDGTQCVILLDPNARNASVFNNLLCIDQKGNPIWIAKLPRSTDVFTSIREVDEGIQAYSWEGFLVLLDKKSGSELRKKFVK